MMRSRCDLKDPGPGETAIVYQDRGTGAVAYRGTFSTQLAFLVAAARKDLLSSWKGQKRKERAPQLFFVLRLLN